MALDWYGTSRVVGEAKSLPQQAERLSAELPLREGELLIDVDTLNIDAASFAQLKAEAKGNAEKIGEAILSIVKARGKMHNPVTGSGGMLLGSVAEISPLHPAHGSLQKGQRIATLVSLTLTPLQLKEIKSVDVKTDRVEVSGHAILFPSGQFAAQGRWSQGCRGAG